MNKIKLKDILKEPMTLREYLSGQVVIGLVFNRPSESVESIANLSVEIAEALIKRLVPEDVLR